MEWPTAGDDLYATCENVQQWAHRRFRYVDDSIRWKDDANLKAGEHWETDAELIEEIEHKGFVDGDCDAFAKLAWMALRRLKVPSRLVMCLVPGYGYHLVCEAEGWIMDNRQKYAMRRDDLEAGQGYFWLSKSAYEPGGGWTTIPKE